MTEGDEGKQGKIPYEDFFRQAILNLRDLSKSRGIHCVFSDFNNAFRKYYGEDPVKIAQQLASEGKIEIRPVRRGVMIYLPGEGPKVRSDGGEQVLAKILGKPTQQEESMIDEVIKKVVPSGIKAFPGDFSDEQLKNEELVEVEVPGTALVLAPNSQTLVTSPKRHFRYEARNPSEAKFIIYAHNIGGKIIEIPKNNQVLFRTVVNYEKYCQKIAEQCFELFLERTNNESMAESLTIEILRRLDLRAGKESK
jgi:hypothetical protein